MRNESLHRSGTLMRLPAKAATLLRAASVCSGVVILTACQTLSQDGGVAPVSAYVGEELGMTVMAIRNDDDASVAREAVERLLKRPLTVDTAVQVALLNNRGLQAAFNELGVAEAEMVGESLPPSPKISLSRLAGAGELELERKIVGDILALATLPARAELASKRFRQAQLRAIADTLRVAADARRTFHRTVAANEAVGFLGEAQAAARSAAQLAKRLGETGALNKLDQAREQVFYADVTTQLAAARRSAESERERFIRALGLWGGDLGFRLVRALPQLPAKPRTLPAVEAEAVKRRVDLQVARIEADLLAKSYGLSQATRFINLLEVSSLEKKARKPDGDIERHRGVEVEFRIPLFDFGQVRVTEAEQTYMAAVNRLTEKAVNARSEAREAYRSYRAAYDIASHYQREVLPLRQIISDEMLLRYNAMQIDVLTLLAEARQRMAANVAAIEARRDFWLADVNLHMALVGGSPSGGAADSMKTAAAAPAAAAGH